MVDGTEMDFKTPRAISIFDTIFPPISQQKIEANKTSEVNPITRSNPYYQSATKLRAYPSLSDVSDEFTKPVHKVEPNLVKRNVRRRSPPPGGVSRTIAQTVRQFENTEDVPIKKYDLTTNEPVSLLYPSKSN